ncbi:MAG TPA: GNAT family N-acetyltransferase [Firmicutes bacterium]|jgi:RimJ/RimL family protein N-acetyltransferase|nr:GNAT family N-acetyltransferase [Bacillota bacterium]
MWQRPERKTLEGNWVRLEILDKDLHSEDLWEMAIGKPNEKNDIFQYMLYGPFSSKNEFQEWLEKQMNMIDRYVYAVYSKRMRKYVGVYSILNIDEKYGRAELGGIWYGKEAQKTEINTEASFVLLKYLFESLQYRRVEWKCDNDNMASKNAAIRLGFTDEGLFRKHMIVKGKNRDTAWYSIIDSDWNNVKNNFTGYLLR